MTDMGELVDYYLDQEGCRRTEGRAGLVMLATLSQGLGYKDPMYFGQLTPKASMGDLMEFFQDNPGAVQAVVEWVKEQRAPEWQTRLLEICPDFDSEEELSSHEDYRPD